MRWYPPGRSATAPRGGTTIRATGCIAITGIAIPLIVIELAPPRVVVDSCISTLRATGLDAPTSATACGPASCSVA